MRAAVLYRTLDRFPKDSTAKREASAWVNLLACGFTATLGPVPGCPFILNDTAIVITVPVSKAGLRVDQALSALLPDYSRALLQTWLKTGRAQVDGKTVKPRDRVHGGEEVRIESPSRETPDGEGRWQPESGTPLNLAFVDEDILVVDKPAALVVHPGAGNSNGTLANYLLGQFPELALVPRAGIVHRLDKDTSGLLLVARSLRAHTHLVEMISGRLVTREYEAVVQGQVRSGGTIDEPIGRDASVRTRMAIRSDGRPAITHYRVLAHLDRHTHLRLRLESGRTHQIRVHMRFLGHPIIGDPVYGPRAGGRMLPTPGGDMAGGGIKRQALHARSLAFEHPVSSAPLRFDSPLPAEITALLDVLRHASNG